jgi:rhodanese-related sulfurtransferase
MKYTFFIVLSVLFASFELKAQVTTIAPAEAEQKMQKRKTKVLDVRTPKEFAEGHLPNAVNIDVMDSASFIKQIQLLKKRKNYVVYCRSGKRSLKASAILVQNGFKNIYNMEGGILEWKGALQKQSN